MNECLSAVDLGKMMSPPVNGNLVNLLLESHGLIERINGDWSPTLEGLPWMHQEDPMYWDKSVLTLLNEAY